MSEAKKYFKQNIIDKINKLPLLTQELIEHNTIFIHGCRENRTNNKADIEHIIQQLGVVAGIRITVAISLVQAEPGVIAKQPMVEQPDEVVEKVMNNKKKLFLPSRALGPNKAEITSTPEPRPNNRPRNR